MNQCIRRPQFLFFTIEDEDVFDIESFLQGKIEISQKAALAASSVLTGRRLPVEAEDIHRLSQAPTNEWIPLEDYVSSVGAETAWAHRMIKSGLLLSDAEGEVSRLSKWDESFRLQSWNSLAAFYHFMTTHAVEESSRPAGRFEDLASLPQRSEGLVAEHVAKYGPPPHPFHHRDDALSVKPLPLPDAEHPFLKTLLGRRTTRVFDTSRKLDLESLSSLLRFTFGCQSLTRLGDEVTVLGKTSPSGGSLHPIEVYPLILRAEGLETGLYHYDVERHALANIRTYDLEEAESLADDWMAGQSYGRTAAALFFMTARFQRNFWKYRKNRRTYSVILMDAGHLSQTFYLTATHLGLGAFFSAAIDNALVEQALELEPTREGVLAVCGCGLPAESERLELDRSPFVPKRPLPEFDRGD